VVEFYIEPRHVFKVEPIVVGFGLCIECLPTVEVNPDFAEAIRSNCQISLKTQIRKLPCFSD
jgi:hypothetical protein